MGILCSILSCNQIENKEQKNANDALPKNIISSDAAVEKNNQPDRKFIRTADIKFKVKDVINTTTNIENICSNQAGFVIYTNLVSNVDEHTESSISSDSLLETTFYTVTNNMTLRVPNTKLDTTLKEIAKNIEYLDSRIIKADDVSIQILANNLTERRMTNNYSRLINDIEKNRKKLAETGITEETAVNKQEQADNAKLNNLSLDDKIKFSTINLSIYQRQAVKRDVIYNEKNIDKFAIGFWKKLFESIKEGWNMLLAIIVYLSKWWGLFLAGVAIFLGIKWYRKISAKQRPQ